MVLIAAAALLAGCGGSTSGTATTSPVPASSAVTSGAAPTAEQAAWAGQVCTGATTVKKDVEGLASAATSGGSDASAALTAQMATIKTSATALATKISAVPAGSENDPQAAAVRTSADDFKGSVAALESAVSDLEGASGLSKAKALVTVGGASADSLSKLGATTHAITAAAADGKSTLGQAFAAAPACSALTK